MDVNVWNDILSRVEAKVNRHSFYTWFKPTSLLEKSGQKLTVRVPNVLFRDWLTKHYSGVIGEAVTELDCEGIKISFVTDAEVSASPPLPHPQINAQDKNTQQLPRKRGLNPSVCVRYLRCWII